jgi:hypothetical protein
MLVMNMPYALGVKPVYGQTMNWINWFTYLFIVVSFLGSLLAYFISRQIYILLKLPRIKKII